MTIGHLDRFDGEMWPLSEAIIYFQSVFDGFHMMLCDNNIKVAIKSAQKISISKLDDGW